MCSSDLAAGVRHISHRRFLATFPLASVGRSEQDLYRCVSQAPRGAGVSNFAELIVKGQPIGLEEGPSGGERIGRSPCRGVHGASSLEDLLGGRTADLAERLIAARGTWEERESLVIGED